MAEPMSDAEKIRAKRLAKLGSSSASGQPAPQADAKSSSPPPPAAAGASSSSSSSSKAAPTQQTSPPAGTSTQSPNPFSQLGVKPDPTPPTKINIVPAKPAEKTRKRASPDSEDSPEDWTDKQLRSIFRLTLNPEEKQDRRGNKVYHVGGVRAELEEQGAPLKLGIDFLDQALIEAASNLSRKVTPLDYFLSCWKRVSDLWYKWKPKPKDERRETVEDARRLCMSYCVFAATVPDMFGRSAEDGPLAPHFLVDQSHDRGLDHEFLLEINSRVPEDDEARSAVVGAIERLSRDMRAMTMNDNYKPYTLALRNVVRYPALVDALVQSDIFLPEDIEASRLEVDTLLGPFFQISPLQGPVAGVYFGSPRTMDRGKIAGSQDALRMSLRSHQTDLDDVVDKFIKRSKATRDKMLDWFAKCVNLNHKRRALQVDQKTVSSDGFMLNVTSCLDNLCDPFIDSTFSKLDRIDPNYLRRNPRVNIDDETKINADQQASDSFYAQKADGESNFISEIFFLNVAAHHYGTEAIASSLKRIEKDLKYMEKHIGTLEADREKIAITQPAQLPMYDRALAKYRDQLDKGISYKFSIQGVLLDKPSQQRSIGFMRYVIVWMLRLVSPDRSYPEKPLKLPLPENQAEVFKCLPEYFVDDVVSNFRFIVSSIPEIVTSTQSEELVSMCITFLRSSEYIKNPYLKAGLITILFAGTWPVYGQQKGVLTDLMHSMKFSTDHLLHAIMKFYIEVEKTGQHTQFYDKFNIRYEIFQIIKTIWTNQVYRDRLAAEAKVNIDFFVHFVNLLLNDVTYVLDEALSSLSKIRDIEHVLRTEGVGMEATVKQEKEEALSEAKRQAKSYMQLTNETMDMLNRFTEALPESFTVPEIVQRLANMLNLNLDAMVGPKRSQLKVSGDMKEYSFDPLGLLSTILSVYLNLGGVDSFVKAIARDESSYKDKNFQEAGRLVVEKSLMSPVERDRLDDLAKRVREAKELEDQEEQDYGEVPDEYMDPIMATIMENPVILPTSKVTVDWSTIRSHLLSDPNDPFNRVPLKIEDVIPDTELKTQIEAFKAEKRGQKSAGSDQMDTS